MPMYLIDTNVMMAASAASELSLVVESAMPLEPELRENAHNWLSEFEASDDRIVLDDDDLIRDEYERNLLFNYREQEFGLWVLQSKLDRCLDERVPIDVREGNGERIAVLEPALEALVTDREDRKWVACSVAVRILHEASAPIVYAAEMDWFVIERALAERGVQFVRLLPDDWYEERLCRL